MDKVYFVMNNTIGTPVLWCSFGVFSIILMTIDFGIQKIFCKYKENSIRLALFMSFIWIISAILFDLLIWFYIRFTINIDLANKNFLTFMAGYFVEKSLSIDNIAVWFFLFQLFSVPVMYQRTVLYYGIIGALMFRSSIIFFSVWLLSTWSFVFYIFSIILLFTGIKMIFSDNSCDRKNVKSTPIIDWIYRNFRLTKKFSHNQFFSKENGVTVATPLFLVLILIEFNDILFSIDSIPAIFSITQDPFLIITSSFFSIIGLRSIYVILANSIQKMRFLKYGIALILVFISIKMLLKNFFYISTLFSFVFILSVLISFILLNKFYFIIKN